jgi:hypothetical protein
MQQSGKECHTAFPLWIVKKTGDKSSKLLETTKSVKSNMPPAELIFNLRTDPTVKIMPVDMWNVTVLMDTGQHSNKISHLGTTVNSTRIQQLQLKERCIAH